MVFKYSKDKDFISSR